LDEFKEQYFGLNVVKTLLTESMWTEFLKFDTVDKRKDLMLRYFAVMLREKGELLTIINSAFIRPMTALSILSCPHLI
jgi:hypothetical protein